MRMAQPLEPTNETPEFSNCLLVALLQLPLGRKATLLFILDQWWPLNQDSSTGNFVFLNKMMSQRFLPFIVDREFVFLALEEFCTIGLDYKDTGVCSPHLWGNGMPCRAEPQLLNSVHRWKDECCDVVVVCPLRAQC